MDLIGMDLTPERRLILLALVELVHRETLLLDGASARLDAVLSDPEKHTAEDLLNAQDECRERADRLGEVCDALDMAVSHARREGVAEAQAYYKNRGFKPRDES